MALVWYYVCEISRVSFSIPSGSTGNLTAMLKLGKTMCRQPSSKIEERQSLIHTIKRLFGYTWFQYFEYGMYRDLVILLRVILV
ncbi:NGFI-A-binding 2 [Gossypium arboreum]|uniref:NGFI-A-binding 2 n=1 Tax=Gossypium arboreum TaxID=29729 RepID=A0A0B0NK22_GOSAR|nr:NGFI-A-binding 2 [Gossypium arboreum]